MNQLENITTASLESIFTDSLRQDFEGHKLVKNNIHRESKVLQSKRDEHIKALKDQLKNAPPLKGCYRAVKSVTQVIKVLEKPLSLITAGKIKGIFSSSLDALIKAKEGGAKMGLQIKSQELGNFINKIKQVMVEDMSELKDKQQETQKEMQTILKILEDLQISYKNN